MWIALAFLSALLLGAYDVCKKTSLRGNAVIPVLFLNTALCAALFLPLIAGSSLGLVPAGSPLSVAAQPLWQHALVASKAVLVLTSWVCGYFAIKHLPLTLVGPVNATRPVMVLLGALLLFGERLNAWQWGGVLLAVLSFFLLSRSGRAEGFSFSRSRWGVLLVASAVLGAASGLYDKYLLGVLGLDVLFVQSWYNLYQALLMGLALWLLWWPRRWADAFSWRWSIVFISLFLTAADLAYFTALSQAGALVSVVSMVRRGSVLVSFGFGALVLRERHIGSRALDLLLVLLGMVLLYVGTA